MNCSSPFILTSPPYSGMAVPCRRCLPCRIAKSSEWALRIANEYTTWEHGAFVTLTYADEHLPKNSSLVPADLKNFLKRLRYYLGSTKIKYYACGEYGEKRHRPHYHLLLLGLDYKTHKLERCYRGGYYVLDGVLKKAWDLGLIHVGDVTNDSISYVSHYIDKKKVGSDSRIYTDTGREPPFQRASQGFGLTYAQLNKATIEKHLFIVNRGKKVPVPSYYRKKLGLQDDPRFREMALESQDDIYREHLARNNIDVDSKEYKRIHRLMTLHHSQRDIKDFAFKKLSHSEIVAIYDMFNQVNSSRHASRMQNTTNLNAKYERGAQFFDDAF